MKIVVWRKVDNETDHELRCEKKAMNKDGSKRADFRRGFRGEKTELEEWKPAGLYGWLESALIKQKKKRKGEQLLISQYGGLMAALLGREAADGIVCRETRQYNVSGVCIEFGIHTMNCVSANEYAIPDTPSDHGDHTHRPIAFITALLRLNRSLESHQLDHLILGCFLLSDALQWRASSCFSLLSYQRSDSVTVISGSNRIKEKHRLRSESLDLRLLIQD